MAEKVTMQNNRKLGRVFPYENVGVGPGDQYQVSETLAKKMEKLHGQVRVTVEPAPEPDAAPEE